MKEVEDITLKPYGRLDIDSINDFYIDIKNAIDSSRDLILDLEEISLITTPGIQVIVVLLNHVKEHNINLQIKNINEQLKQNINDLGFNKIIGYEK